MYYPQNTHSINTVILSFDSVVTGLAKLRYNYYRRFCKLYDHHLDVAQYFEDCHSYQTMYSHCPIPSQLITSNQLGSKVEDDLYAYCLNHGIKIQEGFDELYELIRSKNMKLIYTSTHPKKYTEPLFVLTGSLYRPSKFYYDDESIYEEHKNHPNEVLVITSDIHTLKLANKYHYNVIFYPMVQDENDEITIRSFAVIHHLIEAINLILDKWREPRHQYLLINDQTTIDEAYNDLLKKSSSTLHSAITKIYNEEKVLQTQESVIEEECNQAEPIISEEKEATIEEKQIAPILEDGEELFEKTMVFNFETDELEEESFTLEPFEEEHSDTKTDIETILNDLHQRDEDINHTKVFTKEELKEFGMSEEDLYLEDEDEEIENKEPLFITLFNSFIYAIVDAIIVLLAYLALSIGLYDWVFKPNAPLSFVNNLVKLILDISMKLFGNIAESIGQTLNASASLVEGMAVFAFLTIVLWIVVFIKNLILNRRDID